MSLKVKLKDISDQDRLQMNNDLLFEKDNGQQIYAYDICDNDIVYLPFNYAKSKGYKRPKRNCFSKANMKFQGKLRELQETVASEAIENLNKNGSTILALYTGGGKTFTSCYLACQIRLKTLIIVNRIVLIKQWKETIEKASPLSEIQVIHAKTKLKDADFYIVNAVNVYKKGKEFFKDIGCVIADEIHLLATKVLSQAFFYVYPRYLIGLSATPYRSDGMDNLLFSFFSNDIIYRKLYRKHTIYKIKTNLKPEFTIARNGKIDWNSLLNWQASCKQRNKQIVDLVVKYPDRVFLILCKRIVQVELLQEAFEKLGETVTILIGGKKTFNEDARILIGTAQKCGVGFDHPKLNTLLIASDLLEYFIQYLGRVFRTETVEPIIFDFVDEHSILYKHYLKRRKVYIEHGGTVNNKCSKIKKKNKTRVRLLK